MTQTEQPEGTAHGSGVIAVDQFLPHPRDVVWRALVDPAQLAAWFMPNDFVPVVGHRFVLQRKANCDLRFSDTIACCVLEVREPELLSYSWTDAAEYSSDLDSVVTWTLRLEGRGTRLLLEHRGFRPDDPVHQTAYDVMNGGWRIYIADRLAAYLDGQPAIRLTPQELP